MSIQLIQQVKELTRRIDELEKSKPVAPVVQEKQQDSALVERVTKLENQYRMLNARVSRGKTDG